jgi:hypothetical protein
MTSGGGGLSFDVVVIGGSQAGRKLEGTHLGRGLCRGRQVGRGDRAPGSGVGTTPRVAPWACLRVRHASPAREFP